MIFNEKRITLKNGTECLLRSPGPDDAEGFLEHLKRTTSESDHMLRYPEEITLTAYEEAEFLAKYPGDPKSMMIAAEADGKIIASAGLSCVMNVLKCRHRATFGMAVQKDYWNLGVGSVLLDGLIEAAKSAGYEHLELEVSSQNEAAVRLYQRFGFEICGTRDKFFKFKDGSFSSGYVMEKSL